MKTIPKHTKHDPTIAPKTAPKPQNQKTILRNKLISNHYLLFVETSSHGAVRLQLPKGLFQTKCARGFCDAKQEHHGPVQEEPGRPLQRRLSWGESIQNHVLGHDRYASEGTDQQRRQENVTDSTRNLKQKQTIHAKVFTL